MINDQFTNNFQVSIFKIFHWFYGILLPCYACCMILQGKNSGKKGKYDLAERTAVFGEAIILMCRSIPLDAITKPLINQLIRSATSIGLNYAEAINASSKKDFRNKIHIVKKECQETKLTLRFLAAAVPSQKDALRKHWKECHELTLIFQTIVSSLKHSPSLSEEE